LKPLRTAVWLAVILAGLGHAENSFRQYPDAGSFADDLRRMENAPPMDLPDEWRVVTSQGTYTISTAPLKKAADARAWLKYLEEQVDGFGATLASGGAARSQMAAILAQKEFAGARPPNALERWIEHVRNAIWSWLNALFHFGEMPPVGSLLIFAGAVVVALAVLVLVLQRERESYRLGLKTDGFGMPLRSWEEWARSARAAAEDGDLRKAILCAYWAGISRLQASGDLPADMTKTPREYLRAFGPTGSPVGLALRALTLRLETFWYGPGRATEADLAACFEALRDVGCRTL
jgi:hypothetical protein